ncbi:uncharacterized protein RJT20DRAFT_137815 [Scheffersomyces xylosifermentans]|uniref:uncharacterized protein n=1 Tax=Scheffersomyces xylosifermentans TaxID=1304137 RepID=UPI00315CFD40
MVPDTKVETQLSELRALLDENESLIAKKSTRLEDINERYANQSGQLQINEYDEMFAAVKAQLESLLSKLKSKKATNGEQKTVDDNNKQPANEASNHRFSNSSNKKEEDLELPEEYSILGSDHTKVERSQKQYIHTLRSQLDSSIDVKIRQNLDELLDSVSDLSSVVPASPTNDRNMSNILHSVNMIIDSFEQ